MGLKVDLIERGDGLKSFYWADDNKNMKVFGKTKMPTVEVDSFTLTEMCMKESGKKFMYIEFSICIKNFNRDYYFMNRKFYIQEFLSTLLHTHLRQSE